MSDIARKLGESLLSKDKLTQSEVQTAILAAREEARKAALITELASLASQLRFAVRIKNDTERGDQVRRIAVRLMEIVGDE